MPIIRIDSPVFGPAPDPLEPVPALACPLPVSREASKELSISPLASPTAAVRIHLDLSVQAGGLRAWENKAAAEADELLEKHGTTTVEHLRALSHLARLGWAAEAIQELQEISAEHDEKPEPFVELAKAQILAGDYDGAVKSSAAARSKGFVPEHRATDLQARAHLLQGAREKAASALKAGSQRHVLTSEMVKFANRQPGRKPQIFDLAITNSAKDMAEYFAWRRDASAVVAWMNQAILAGACEEISEFLNSPFIAPIMHDAEFQRLLAGLDIQLKELPASKVGTGAFPSPSPRAG